MTSLPQPLLHLPLPPSPAPRTHTCGVKIQVHLQRAVEGAPRGVRLAAQLPGLIRHGLRLKLRDTLLSVYECEGEEGDQGEAQGQQADYGS